MQPNEIFELIRVKFPQVTQEEQAKAVVVPKELFLDVAGYLKGDNLCFDNLHCLTAIDRKVKLELVYIFYSFKMRHSITLKIYLGLNDLEVESLARLWKSADWLERETYDLFGIKFLNHPDLRRILNPYEWKGYPLRKDYTHPNLIKKPQY